MLFNERVQTRLLQAIGRCTRSLEDFSAVVVSGEDVPEYLADRQRRMYLHPELQAELDFGIEQSQGTTLNSLLENFDTFLRNDVEWKPLVASSRNAPPSSKSRSRPLPNFRSRGSQIKFQKCLWQGDYETALSAAERTLAGLTVSELKGYRALWHYLAGSAAWLASQRGVSSLSAKARDHFAAARKQPATFLGSSSFPDIARQRRRIRRTDPCYSDSWSGLSRCLRNSASSTTEILTIGKREYSKALLPFKGPFEGSSAFFGRNARLLSRQKRSTHPRTPGGLLVRSALYLRIMRGRADIHTRCYEGAASLHPSTGLGRTSR